MSFKKVSLGCAILALSGAGGAEAFSPTGPLALRSRVHSSTASLGLKMGPSFSQRGASEPTDVRDSGWVTNRRDFGKLIAGVIVAGGMPGESFAAKKQQQANDGTIQCRAVANTGATMGGTQCEGIQEVEFTPAFRTGGTATKPTGPADKLSTYYSQISAGYLTLVDLEKRWDQYVAAGDGDVIRRRLGTVGSKSPLHNILKCFEGAVKSVSNSVDAEKFDELDELYNQTVQGIAEVDYFMYSTGFVGTKETADGLRVNGKESLQKVLGLYKRLITILEPLNV